MPAHGPPKRGHFSAILAGFFRTVASNWVWEGKEPLLRHSPNGDILARIIKVLHQRVSMGLFTMFIKINVLRHEKILKFLIPIVAITLGKNALKQKTCKKRSPKLTITQQAKRKTK